MMLKKNSKIFLAGLSLLFIVFITGWLVKSAGKSQLLESQAQRPLCTAESGRIDCPDLHLEAYKLWQVLNSGPAAQTFSDVAYDSKRGHTLLVWQDGRNDPQGLVDQYGFNFNGDILAREYDTDGQPLGGEIAIATRGEWQNSERYDNESRPRTVYHPILDRYLVTWSMYPDSVLQVGDLKTTTCEDVAYREVTPLTHQLSSSVLDLAWYTPPVNLVDPWGNHYDWSCQQDPVISYLEGYRSLVLWQDHRERFAKNQGMVIEKDVYTQLIDHGNRLKKDSYLISFDSSDQKRLPLHQERPEVARGKDNLLVVWADERRSNKSEYVGFREIYGRYLIQDATGIKLDQEILLAEGKPGDTKLFSPKVGYLDAFDRYVVVFTRSRNYLDKNNHQDDLMVVIVDSQGNIITQPQVITDTQSNNGHVPSLACKKDRCFLVYRKNTGPMYGRVILADGFVTPAFIFDYLDRYHTYSHTTAGQVAGDRVNFYTTYTVGKQIFLAKIVTKYDPDQIIPSPSSPTITLPFPLSPTPIISHIPTLPFQPSPTSSPTPTSYPVSNCLNRFDFNCDQRVDIVDYNLLINNFDVLVK